MIFRRRRSRYLYTRKRKKFNKKLLRELLSWAIITVCSILMAVLVVFSFGRQTTNIGDSMEPTIGNGQQILLDVIRYKAFSPGSGSVIAFVPGGNKNTHYYIKRVVAVPGDRVQIMDGELYVNGVMAEAEDAHDKMEDAGIAENEITLGEDEYFVLGDNRNSSEDSRSGNIGPVKKEQIIGKAWFHFGGTSGGMGFIQ